MNDVLAVAWVLTEIAFGVALLRRSMSLHHAARWVRPIVSITGSLSLLVGVVLAAFLRVGRP